MQGPEPAPAAEEAGAPAEGDHRPGCQAAGAGGRGPERKPSSPELEACPTSSAVEGHLSGLTDAHYGRAFNQLNLGHRGTMAGAFFGGCREAEVPEPPHLACT